MRVDAEPLPMVTSTPNAAVKLPSRYAALAMLILAYTFNFLDRQILGILAGPIKRDLDLTDAQLGLMGGLAFAFFYTALGIPVATLADRWNRTWIMTGALALWSAFTALCGLATGFTQLFLCRMGVGIGEAGGVAPAYSLIADYFPKNQRARALAAYSFGIPIGSAAGLLFGGLIAKAVSWRAAFIAVGLAGVVLAPLFRWVVREPPRQVTPTAVKAPFRQAMGLLLAKPSFWFLSLGAAASSICGYGVGFWLPTFFERSLHLGLVERSVFLAAVMLVGGIAGVWGGGVLADKLGAKNPRMYPIIPAIAFVVAMPVFLGAVNTDNLYLAFVLFLIPQGLNLVWLGPILTSVQHLVPAQMRSTASATFLFINNLVGISFGLYYFGKASDLLRPAYGDESMRYAMYSGLAFYVVASVLFVLASRRLKKDWVD